MTNSEKTGSRSAGDDLKPSALKSYVRIFSYADGGSWILFSVAFAAAVAAGAGHLNAA